VPSASSIGTTPRKPRPRAGDLAYGREDWLRTLIAADKQEGLEPLRAWAKRMLLDTSYAAQPAGGEPVRLAQLRAALIEHYLQVGPIFA
jgi:hypothetical protein